ncbi:hypothetical protein PoB_003119400 [Plakobranchus ocellatus]|uniref:Uncharacterized protein n=1 Tax=Plakobranchus ocellatus TaxID=259542 RepID=A0AAV4AE23_9GAST|nr:hypothetical protein PoB_003119400 [Plakobranchus ocellatus]
MRARSSKKKRKSCAPTRRLSRKKSPPRTSFKKSPSRISHKKAQSHKNEGMVLRAVRMLGIQRLLKYVPVSAQKSVSASNYLLLQKPKKKMDKPTVIMQPAGQPPKTLLQRTLQVAWAAWATKPKSRAGKSHLWKRLKK